MRFRGGIPRGMEATDFWVGWVQAANLRPFQQGVPHGDNHSFFLDSRWSDAGGRLPCLWHPLQPGWAFISIVVLTVKF